MATVGPKSSYEGTLAEESSISDAPEARFECPICLAWLRDPVLTQCGHRFCRNCIHSWLEKNSFCPVDNMKLEIDKDIFPDNFTRREISQQRMRCPNISKGCFEELSPLDIDAHLLVCKFRPPQLPDNEKLRCLFVEVGCDRKFDDDPELQRHLEQDIQHHLILMSQSYSKLTISSQASTSAIAQQANFWDPPSKSEQNQKPADSTQNLLKALFERIVILEQKTREQDIIIANMSEQINSNNLAMSKLSLRYCNGCYIWYVTDFKSKIEAMRNNHHVMYYSPGFFTSPHGYKFCIRFNLSPRDPSYIAILVHVMRTDHDNTLDWPFSGRFTIALVHPIQSFRSVKETMMTRPELEAFKRPSTEMNPKGFGYTEFVLLEELFTQDFIDKNQLLVKVTVQAV